jgi:hypothetical protein
MIKNSFSQDFSNKKTVRILYSIVSCFLILTFFSGCSSAPEKMYPSEVREWIDKDTFSWGVSLEQNENSFIRNKVNAYCSWSKKTLVNSGIVLGLIWTIIDYFIVGFLSFFVFISDLVTLRFGGAISCLFEYVIYDVIKFFGVFGVYF